MENKKEYKPMPKWLIYTLFILKFVLGLALIWWTVMMTFKADVGKDDDNAFLSNYHQMNDNYNIMVDKNTEFSSKYNVKFLFNSEAVLGLSHHDIYLSQRNIKEREFRKHMLEVGTNTITVKIQDKNGNEIKNKQVNILVTKNNTHEEDVKLKYLNEDTKTFEIKSIGYWNITGTVEVDGSVGSFYIKTNATNKAQ